MARRKSLAKSTGSKKLSSRNELGTRESLSGTTASALNPGTKSILVWPLILISLLVFAAFSRVLFNDFISFDDPLYVTGNFHVQSGLAWNTINWAFTTTAAANWHPLTWLSHILDYELYGLKPWGHHLTNLLLHSANTLIVFLVLKQMTGATWRSWFVAALFGLHPMHVESVAWVSERKDVLSTFFGLLSLRAYGRYALGTENSNRRWFHYGTALVWFILSLLSKPMLVTLPFILLLLDYWPLNRLQNVRLQTLVLEKLPFLLLTAVSCTATFMAQRVGGAMTEMSTLPIGDRVQNALVAYIIYLGKLLVPVHLAVIYPYDHHQFVITVILAAALLLGLSIFIVRARRQRPWLLTGWFWFLGMMIPVIGLVQVGPQAMADRYSYLSFTGLFIILSWGAEAIIQKSHQRKTGLQIAAALMIIGCALLSWRQTGYWKNSGVLFQHALDVTASNYIAYADLGDYELAQGHGEQAITLYQDAIKLAPHFAPLYAQLGSALCQTERLDEGIQAFKQSISLDPKAAQAHADFGSALVQAGQYDSAINEYQETIRLDPDYLEAYDLLGVTLENAGRFDEAIAWLGKAVRLYPSYVEAHNNLGLAFENKGQTNQAISEYQETIRLDPSFAKGYLNLGMILESKGQLDEAIAQFQKGLKLQSDSPQAHNELGILYMQKGRLNDAATEFQEAVKLKPDYDLAKDNLKLALKMARQPNPR